MPSIRVLPSGSFQAAVLTGTGKRMTKAFPTEAEALDWALDQEHQRLHGRQTLPSAQIEALVEAKIHATVRAQAAVKAEEVENLKQDHIPEYVRSVYAGGELAAQVQVLIEVWQEITGRTWNGQ